MKVVFRFRVEFELSHVLVGHLPNQVQVGIRDCFPGNCTLEQHLSGQPLKLEMGCLHFFCNFLNL